MTDENIVQLPTRLERLAKEINTYLRRDAINRAEWIDIQEGICLRLAEARSDPDLSADIVFGEWCEANGFGKEVMDDHTRAAAIAMGSIPKALRACLEATDRKSLRTIYSHDFPRFDNGVKPPMRRRKTEKTKVDEVAEYIRPKVEAGETVSRSKIADEMGVGERVVEIARERELGRLQGLAERPPMTPAEMSRTMGQRYEAALRKARLEIRDELRDEVYAELNVFMASRKKKIEWAEQIEKNFKGVMDRATFRLIRNCLHPDHNTFAHAAEAFHIFSKMENVLVKPDPTPLPAGVPPLPSTVAELMARRRTKWR